MKRIFTAIAFITFFFAVIVSANAQNQCEPAVWDLHAGKADNKVGTLTITNDVDNIYLSYQLTEGVFNEEIQAWVGQNWVTLPYSANDENLKLGQFPYKSGAKGIPSSVGQTEYTLTIPLSGIGTCGSTIHVVTHTEVNGEGVFAGYIDVHINEKNNRWYWYGDYAVCCDPDSGEGECWSETAFAYGTHVFASQKKANPDNLPSINLTLNKWGWAINLTSPGTTVYDIYAAAGLNSTANGVKVGTLTIDWDGTNAIVKYTMLEGYYLEEVHIYAGDDVPTTTAPGQYGYPENYDADGVSNAEYTVPLEDTNGLDGVWLIAHAVVSNGFCQ